jgi:hypothetical protein
MGIAYLLIAAVTWYSLLRQSLMKPFTVKAGVAIFRQQVLDRQRALIVPCVAAAHFADEEQEAVAAGRLKKNFLYVRLEGECCSPIQCVDKPKTFEIAA